MNIKNIFAYITLMLVFALFATAAPHPQSGATDTDKVKLIRKKPFGWGKKIGWGLLGLLVGSLATSSLSKILSAYTGGGNAQRAPIPAGHPVPSQ